MSAPATVAVVGGGASGCLTAIHLARTAAREDREVALLFVEPGCPGRGVAYSTDDVRHHLNVCAAKMSALPDEPGHFLRWLHEHVDAAFPADGFAPRPHFGAYLEHTLLAAVRGGRGITLEHVRDRVVSLRRHHDRYRIELGDGSHRIVDASVLATGYGAPSVAWAPAALRESPRFVRDPWQRAEPLDIPPGGDVVLVGAGLTMTDMAVRWGRADVRLHIVSRHGMLPLPHAPAGQPAPLSWAPDRPTSVGELRRLVFEHIRAAGGDWRAAIDGLRPVTTELWSHLSESERAQFLRSTSRRWDRVRHRVDPDIHAWLAQRQSAGAVSVHAGTVVAAVDRETGTVEVTLTDGAVITASAVVNCTGASSSVRRSDDPLLQNMLSRRMIEPGPLDLGLATTADGRVRPDLDVWAVGPLRRGDLWESTAVPEIRCQAASLAETVVGTVGRLERSVTASAA